MRVLVLLALVGAALAAPKHDTKIVGGEATTIEKYPYMSNLLFASRGLWTSFQSFCGGSLITPTSVLSAAHCVEGGLSSQLQIRLGSALVSSGGQVISVSQLLLHAQYQSTNLLNDIAIVKLASAAVLSASVAVARIPGPNYTLPDGTPVVALGWGDLHPDDAGVHEQLQRVTINTINQELCVERYTSLNTQPDYQGIPNVTEGMLCAGILDEGGKDACSGDSGGPVAHDSDVIIGIISWSFGCAHEFYPGVNTRVSSYTDWIVENA